MDVVNQGKSAIALLKEGLEYLGISKEVAWESSLFFIVLGSLFVSLIIYKLVKNSFLKWVEKIIKKTKSKHDDFFITRKVVQRFAYLIPVFIFYILITTFIDVKVAALLVLIKMTQIVLVLISVWVVTSVLNVLLDIYNTFSFSKDRHIDGYIQVMQLVFWLVALLIVISIVFGIKMTAIFTGLGAVAAVLILVFKDTILGFVASIQLSVNRMVKKGDWIAMPTHHADGTVIDISLNTVKVQNWDKTITTIPTYALVANSFNNWKGMEESGGRRIKRSINVDMKSVRFCDDAMIEKLSKVTLLKEFIEERLNEIHQHNKSLGVDDTVLINGRRLTNLGLFRKYLEVYLHNHPKIHDEMTFLVRHLQPTEKGIPIEVYVFSNDQKWTNYESIQADIFDHILAVISEFDLRVFQLPTGDDLKFLITHS